MSMRFSIEARPRSLGRILACAVIAALAGCASSGGNRHATAATTAYVVLGENGAPIVRAITTAARCPGIRIDGREAKMELRAAAATVALRATRSDPADSKPSAFPVTTCEKILPGQVRSAEIEGRALPLPRAEVQRIVVIGDTGCRLKTGEEYQSCNDAAKYPFARVAAKAAEWKPDLVVHVGDYLYRENACPQSDAGCAGSPWGYGWDAWQADFFGPGTALLHAAPWVVVRGNHESCVRAGQGWWRFLDPHPLIAGQDCNEAKDDDKGDYGDPYAVPLGSGAQLIVLDTSNTSNDPIKADDVRHGKYLDAYAKLARLAQREPYAIVANHQPILGLAGKRDKQGGIKVHASSRGISSVFAERNPAILPEQVKVMLAGHTHLWEQLSFRGDYPSQFIAGFSGTLEDVVPMPETLPETASPAPGVFVDKSSSWIYGFGFMTLERQGADRWQIKVWSANGDLVNDCEVKGRTSSCRVAQVK